MPIFEGKQTREDLGAQGLKEIISAAGGVKAGPDLSLEGLVGLSEALLVSEKVHGAAVGSSIHQQCHAHDHQTGRVEGRE